MSGLSPVYICGSCADRSYNVRTFLRHVKVYHSAGKGSIPCDMGRCKSLKRRFKSFNTFRNHVYLYHSKSAADSQDDNNDAGCVEMTELHVHEVSSCHSTLEPSVESDNGTTLLEDKSVSKESVTLSEKSQSVNLEEATALWVLKLRELYMLPVSTVEKIINDTRDLIALSNLKLKRDIMLNANLSSDDMSILQTLIDTTSGNMFQHVQSDFKQQKYFTSKLGMVVEPEEIVLGQKFITLGSGHHRKRKCVKHSFVYIPVLKTLEMLFQNQDILSMVQNTDKAPSEYMSDFCDGYVAKQSPLFQSKNALQLLFYYDDLEVCNPLGSKRKKHKLGVFYFTLANILPEERSTLQSIYVVAIAKVSIIKTFGINSVLKPFVRDLKLLEDGVQLCVGGTKSFLQRGSIAASCADNPASAALSGFKESSSKAVRGCRHCMCSQSDMATKFNENDLNLRCRVDHEQHCHELQTSNNPCQTSKFYGVNFRSQLLDLKYFDICNGGMIPDIMHDLLEGVLPLELHLLLQYFCDEAVITPSHINEIVANFELGYMEAKDRPSPFDLTSCGQSASQMWLLSRLLPVMIGEYIPEDDCHWQNHLLLLKIMDYLFAPVVTREDCLYLKVLIEEHHSTFKNIYPDQNITPKMHSMIHMPRIMLSYGPLSRLWTMRFEAKHQYFKRLVYRINNFINIEKSLAKRHQFLQLYNLKCHRRQKEIALAKVCSNPEELHKYGVKLLQAYKLKWVKVGSTLLQVPCVLLKEAKDLPVFIVLENIFLFGETLYFAGQVYESDFFSLHYHCFVVKSTGEFDYITKLHSHHPYPMHLRYLQILHSYVVIPKHNICSL